MVAVGSAGRGVAGTHPALPDDGAEVQPCQREEERGGEEGTGERNARARAQTSTDQAVVAYRRLGFAGFTSSQAETTKLRGHTETTSLQALVLCRAARRGASQRSTR